MSFVDIHIPTQKTKGLKDTPKNQFNKVSKEQLNAAPVEIIEETANVTSIFPLNYFMSKHTEYHIISDSEESDDDTKDASKNIDNTVNQLATTDESTLKNDEGFLNKLSSITKDIGHFFSHPSNNIRHLLRRREGYLPPEKRLIQDTKSNEN